jgi:hypothetical protein
MIEEARRDPAQTVHRDTSSLELGSSRPSVSSSPSSVSSSLSSVSEARGRDPSIRSTRPSRRVDVATRRRRDLDPSAGHPRQIVAVSEERVSILVNPGTVTRVRGRFLRATSTGASRTVEGFTNTLGRLDPTARVFVIPLRVLVLPSQQDGVSRRFLDNSTVRLLLIHCQHICN